MAQEELESLKRDLDMVRAERDNAQQQVQRSAAAQRQAEAVRLHNFIRALPPLLSIATRLRSLQSTAPTFANAVCSAVPTSFEPPPPGSLQFLALVPVILAVAVLTLPKVPDLEDLASVLRHCGCAQPRDYPGGPRGCSRAFVCHPGPGSQAPGGCSPPGPGRCSAAAVAHALSHR